MPKRVLIAPLDWGLGHATRCIPIIRHLVERGHEPVLCTSGRPGALLKAEFPEVPFQNLEGYNIEYPRGAGMAWKMAVSTPRILKRIKDEEVELRHLVQKWKPDLIISDNRFGFHHPEVTSVYMTHQVMIKAPFGEALVHRFHKNFMEKFHHTWVPDLAESPGISGDLGHKYPLPYNGKFIGPLSRFSGQYAKGGGGLVAVISGPEPQRTLFQELITRALSTYPGRATVVCGMPHEQFDRADQNGHRFVSHLGASELEAVISAADVVVSRSGYSTIMDLAVTGSRAIFTPTPGQTEQEYLAAMYHHRNWHQCLPQHQFDLNKALENMNQFSGMPTIKADGFKEVINALLD